jgi:predicted nucleotidyltransferase
MKETLFLVKYGEIALKKRNRGAFVKALKDSIREKLPDLAVSVYETWHRVYVRFSPADREAVASCLERLSHDPEVAALVLFGSRARDAARPDSDLDLLLIRREPELDGAAVQRLWWQHLQQVWDLPLGLDLVVVGRAEADRLAGSRWHAIGYAAREGKVVYVAE